MNDTWQTKKLSEICSLIKGKKPSVFVAKSNKPYLTAKVVRKTEEPRYAAENCPSSVLVKKEDIVIIMDGSNSGEMFTDLEGALASTMGIIQYPKDLLSPKYLLHFLKTHRENFTKSRTGAAIPHLNKEEFENLQISIPTLMDQQRIAKILDETFEKIEKAKLNTEKNLQNSQKIFDSYLQSIFSNQKEDWVVKRLGEIATLRNGLNFTRGSHGEKIKIVGVKDFQKNFWVPLNLLDSVTIDGKLSETDLLKEGDILTVRSNGNPALIGRMMIAGNVNENISHSGFTIRIRLNSNNIYPQFLCHFLKTQNSKKELIESGTGINIKSLNQGILSTLLISYPKSISEQKEIVKSLDKLSDETKKLESIYKQKLTDLEELKKSILSKAFNGEL